MGIAEIFAINLKRLREARGLTQAQLAEMAGMSVTAVAHFETGRRWPKLVSIRILAAALGVDEVEIFANPSQSAIGPAPTLSEALAVIAPLIGALDRLPTLEPVERILDALTPGWDEGKEKRERD